MVLLGLVLNTNPSDQGMLKEKEETKNKRSSSALILLPRCYVRQL